MTAALVGVTYPAAGVTVARPATAPVSSPKNVGLFSKIQAMTIHTIAAKDAAISVLRNAIAVMASTFNSLPALNPYQPNQSRPVPKQRVECCAGLYRGTFA